MAIVPEFLIKRIYQKGSLVINEGSISLTLKNVLGPGLISGFNYVKINDVVFEAENVKFIGENVFTYCPQLIIKCVENSYAHRFCAGAGIAFEFLRK